MNNTKNIARGDSQPISPNYRATMESLSGLFTFGALSKCTTENVKLWLAHMEATNTNPNGQASARLVLASREIR